VNLAKINLVKSGLISLFLTLFVPVFFHKFSIAFFIPFLVIVLYQKPLMTCLWIAFACGLILDMLQTGIRFGLFGLNYVLCIALLYSKKHHFFGDRISTLPLMTFFLAFLSITLQLVLLYIFQQGFSLSWGLLIYELGILPFEDAIYAFLFFVLPLWFFGKPQRTAREYFLN
jgi:hypothetical protein